jgi:hypothetical protein
MVDKLFKGRAARDIFHCPNMLPYLVSAASTVSHEGIFSWWEPHMSSPIAYMIIEPDLRLKGEYTCAIVGKEIQCYSCRLQADSASNVQLLPSDLEKVADIHKFELHHDVRPKSFSGMSTSSPAVCGLPAEIYSYKILLQQKLDEWWEPRITYPRCSSFSGIGKIITFLVSLHPTHLSSVAHSTIENMFANLIAGVTDEIPLSRPCPDVVPFCGDRIGNLVMLSVNIQMSWDSGGNNHLIREVVLPESAQQALRDIRITPCDSLAHCPYWNYFGKHLGSHYNYTAYIFHRETLLARVMCRSNDHYLIPEGALILELVPLIARKTILGEYTQYKRVECRGVMLTELSDPLEVFPQVHQVNDHGAQLIFALITGPHHDNQDGCEDNLSLTLLICSDFGLTNAISKQLRQSSSDKLHGLSSIVHHLWDPGGSSCRSAWGQAGFQGGGNVMPWFTTWATVWTSGWLVGPNRQRGAINYQRLEQRLSRMNPLNSSL